MFSLFLLTASVDFVFRGYGLLDAGARVRLEREAGPMPAGEWYAGSIDGTAFWVSTDGRLIVGGVGIVAVTDRAGLDALGTEARELVGALREFASDVLARRPRR